MILEDLPYELICMIASYLGGGVDTANWRLTSKHFGRIVAEAHFQVFPVSNGTNRTILRRVRAMSSQMAKHVRVLEYDGEKSNPTEVYSSHHPPSELLCQAAQGLSDAGSPLKILWAQRLRFDFFASRSQVDTFAHACANLRELSLNFRGPAPRSSARPDAQRAEENFRTFLTRLNNVDTLSLIFRDTGLVHNSHRLRDVLPLAHAWPCLHTLRVYGLYFTAPDVEVLRNHAKGLMYVHFRSMDLSNPKVLAQSSEASDEEYDSGSDYGSDEVAEMLAREEKSRDGWIEVIDQVAMMNLRAAYITESRGWPPKEYWEKEENLAEWLVDGDDGSSVWLTTNLNEYMKDEEEEAEEEQMEVDGENNTPHDGEGVLP